MGGKVVIALTLGDVNGIGPEVVLKALADQQLWADACPLVVGSSSALKFYMAKLGSSLTFISWQEGQPLPSGETVALWEVVEGPSVEPGRLSKEAAEASWRFLEKGVELVQKGVAQALVTAPVSKEALWQAGFPYPGQTEFLAKQAGIRDFAMMLVVGSFRVGLVTIHHPLWQVPSLLSEELIRSKVEVIARDLRERFGIAEPRMAVCALNPHAGEGGQLGMEEREIIQPALEALRQSGLKVEGPFPADTLFANPATQTYDAYVAMYHDQGMIPAKMRDFQRGVNYTAGLPFVRTSPDHGTAFNIAGQGIANPQSMKEAIRLAVELVTKARTRRASL